MAKVLKSFNTQTRRFAVGAEVTYSDVPDFEVLVNGGFIGLDPAPSNFGTLETAVKSAKK
jgi:hypothetical protein